MTHLSEDALLAFALDTIPSPVEHRTIAAHLATCSECSAVLARMRRDLQVLGGLAPRTRTLPPPLGRRRARRWVALVQAAALLAAGFVLGRITLERAHREPVCITPSYLNASPPADSLSLYAIADATALPATRNERVPSPR